MIAKTALAFFILIFSFAPATGMMPLFPMSETGECSMETAQPEGMKGEAMLCCASGDRAVPAVYRGRLFSSGEFVAAVNRIALPVPFPFPACQAQAILLLARILSVTRLLC